MKSYLAQFAARAVIAELVSVAELAHPLENGTHFPLFLLCLQQTAKRKDREWLTDLFQQSKVNMQKMLPGSFQDASGPNRASRPEPSGALTIPACLLASRN